MMKISDALTLDDIADLYDEYHSGRPARTLPMERVLDWAEKQTDLIYVHPKDDTFHKIVKKEDKQ